MRLGRIPSSQEAIAEAPAHRFGARPVPQRLDRHALRYLPEDYGNQTLPICTAVAYINIARAIAALNGYDLAVDPNAARDFYAACVGNPPDIAETDGAVPIDVLNLQAQIGVDIGPQRLVALTGTIDIASRTALAHGINTLGAGYWGVTLHDRDMQTFGTGAAWDATSDDGPIVGGHMLMAWDYTGLGDDDTVRLGSWGEWQPATWRWVRARLGEAYGLAWRQLVRADGAFYGALTADGLVAELD